jgi:hypothetical protein
MDQASCNSVRESLIRRLSEDIYVMQIADQCVLTFPFRTLDDRYPDIFVDKKLGGSYLIHDAGKTASHLFAQGIHMTESRNASFKQIASLLGVEFADGMFQVLSDGTTLEASILAVAECIVLGTMDIASHKPTFEDEPVTSIIKRTFDTWNPDFIERVNARVQLKGRRTNHPVDFVAFPSRERVATVAVKVIAPSYSPQAQAERYGFLVLDTEGTIYEQWQKLAVVTKVEQWPKGPLALVRQLSSRTIELRTGEELSLKESIPLQVTALAVAA